MGSSGRPAIAPAMAFVTAATAAAGLAAAALVVVRLRQMRGKPPKDDAGADAIKKELPFLSLQSEAARAAETAQDEEEILAEQLSRNCAFLGEVGQARVEAAFVVVVGVGGAGSHAAQLVGRTGVRRIRLVDAAPVSERSLRSHATATRADLGVAKADVTANSLLRIVPHTAVETVRTALTAESADACLAGSPDCVILCLPDVEPLAIALAACNRLGLQAVPVLPLSASAMRGGSVARQRLSFLHDVCSSIEVRRSLTLLARSSMQPLARSCRP